MFIDGVARMDASTARLARSIGMNIEGMSLWQGIVRQFGGSAADARSTVSSLADELTRVQQTGGPFGSGVFANLLQRAAPNWRQLTAQGNWNQILMQIAQWVEAQPGTAEQKRFWLQSIPGMTPGMLYALQQGTKAINDAAEAARKAGLETDKAGDAAIDYQQKTAQLELSLEGLARETYPALTAAIKSMTGALEDAGRASDALSKGNIGRALFGQFWDYIFSSGASWKGLWDMVRGRTPGGAAGGASGPAGGGGGTGNAAQQEAYIRQQATAMGIDPSVAVQVAKSEGLFGYTGDRGSSFGPFQLHYGGIAPGMMQSGLGDVFTKQTGLDARDPSTWQAQIRFALEYAKTHGWGAWHGWKGLPWAGIGSVGAAASAAARAGGSVRSTTNQHSSSINIDQINVTSNKADPKDVASEIPDQIRRLSTAMGANYALT